MSTRAYIPYPPRFDVFVVRDNFDSRPVWSQYAQVTPAGTLDYPPERVREEPEKLDMQPTLRLTREEAQALYNELGSFLGNE